MFKNNTSTKILVFHLLELAVDSVIGMISFMSIKQIIILLLTDMTILRT